MPLDIQAWLTDLQKKASLSNEELSAMHAILTKPTVKQEVLDAFERQSDYSKKMDELRAKMAEEDSYAQRLAEWEANVKQELTDTKTAAQKYQQNYYALASKYNVSPEELYTAANQPAPTEPAQPVQKPTGDWFTKQEADNYATAMFKINAKLIGLNQEHIRLFGKPMENIEAFTDEALKTGQKIEDTFRTFYKVADRETELREADIQARISKAVEEAKMQWVTTGSNPAGLSGSAPKGWQSPVMENVVLDHTDLADNAAARQRVSEVLQAYNAENAKNGLPTF